VVIDSLSLPTLVDELPNLKGLCDIERMMALDSMTYLPDDILVKVDRAAMAVSLKTRVPFLDYRVFEFAWRLPLSMKLRNGQSKWALWQVLYRHVPKELIVKWVSVCRLIIGYGMICVIGRKRYWMKHGCAMKASFIPNPYGKNGMSISLNNAIGNIICGMC